MKKIIILVVAFSVLNGCSNKHQYQGNGEYAELSHRNIIYRDLTIPLGQQNYEDAGVIESTPSLVF